MQELRPEGWGAHPPEVVVLATGASYRWPLGPIVRRLLDSRWARWARSRALKRLLTIPAIKRLFYSALRTPNVGLDRRLRALGLEVHCVGDCRTPGKTPEAMLDATRLAYRL